MNRRGFLGSLLGLVLAPVAAKFPLAIVSEPKGCSIESLRAASAALSRLHAKPASIGWVMRHGPVVLNEDWYVKSTDPRRELK